MRKFKINIKNLFNENSLILILIIIAGLFLRTFQLKERFLYGHDQDLQGWFIKDVVVDKHIRLIGQETSTRGIFIGGIFYYLLIPFYFLANMDAIGGTYLVTILGLFTIISFYFVFSRVFNKKVGLIGAFIYALSFYTINNDREVVPTMPVILWSVWFFYGLDLLLKGKQKQAFLLFGLLIGLIWHLNFALVLTIPLIVIAQYLSKAKIKTKYLLGGTAVLLLTSLPLIMFELRHGFSQILFLYKSLSTNQRDIISGYEKLTRVWYLMSKDVHGLFMGTFPWLKYETVSSVLLIIFALLAVRKKIEKKLGFIIILWIFAYIVFFSAYSKIVSEYYLNGSMVMWILIFSLFITSILSTKNFRHFGVIIMTLFTVYNLNKFFTFNINRSGYIQKKEIIAEIKDDARKNNYPCISISYITDPGYNLGYRYFFWQSRLHVTNPDSGAPVYTIVFPLKEIFREDRTFGALGLIYPDYARYNPDTIKVSCSGENSNLTDPMFGFTR